MVGFRVGVILIEVGSVKEDGLVNFGFNLIWLRYIRVVLGE